MRIVRQVAMLAAVIIGTAGVAFAVPITYTESATATGSLGGIAFTGALVELTMTTDTSSVAVTGVTLSAIAPATVIVSGVGTASFTDSIAVFVNPSFVQAAAGFSSVSAVNQPLSSILDTFNSVFATYDLQSFIGPITGSPFINDGLAFSTNLGDFILNASRHSTFTASSPASPVPEPATLTLLGVGLLGAAIRRRKSVNR